MRGARTHNGSILNFESNVCHDSLYIDSLLQKSKLLAKDNLPSNATSAKRTVTVTISSCGARSHMTSNANI